MIGKQAFNWLLSQLQDFRAANIANDLFPAEVRFLHFLKGFRFFFSLLCAGFLHAAAPAQPLPGFSLQHKVLPRNPVLALSEDVISQIVPKNAEGFSLSAQPASAKPIFRSFQLHYHQAVLHNYRVLVYEASDGKSMELFYPDVSLESLSFYPEKSGELLVFNGRNWESMQLQTVVSLNPPAAERQFFSESQGLRFREEWILKFSDSSVRARVFRPDPVSRLQMPYGGLLRDRADSSSALLRQAMDSVQIRVRLSGDSFRLENAYLRLGEFSPPVRRRAVAASADSFFFDRNQPGFEEVNVFYHLSRFRDFLQENGFDSLARYPLSIDAHGMGGADQSAFSPLQDVLAFGDGNVDDAEDASVIIHEYGHVLCQSAFPFGNSGQERRALEEGLCDYLAGSYLKSWGDDFMADRIYRWDGNNEFWPGRSLISTAQYPSDLTGSLYGDGAIFCSALNRLESSMGRNNLHRVLFTSLYGLGPNFTMPAAARLILLADSGLFQGENSVSIRQGFLESGIDPGLVVVSSPKPRSSIQRIFFDESGSVFFTGAEAFQQAQLFDAAGRIRRLIPLRTEGRQEIPLEGLAPGIYFLRTESAVHRLPVYFPR